MIDTGGDRGASRPAGWRDLMASSRSLQVRATILVVVLTLSVSTVVSGYLLRSSIRAARDLHINQTVRMASMLARATGPLVASEDRTALQALVEDMTGGPALLYVQVLSPEREELASAQRRGSGLLHRLRTDKSAAMPRPEAPVYHPPTNAAAAYIDAIYPVTTIHFVDGPRGRRSELVGYLRVGVSASGLERPIANKLDLVTGVGILAIAIAIPLGFALVRRIVSPLQELGQVMQEFSAGRLDIRMPVRRQDEIGALEEAFNRMADQHQVTHERIVRLNAELEQRVAERTRQLRDLASREPLTGMYNRRHFQEVLQQRLAEAIRYQTNLACMMIDVDDFKRVNDTYGHQAGDDLLVLISKTIRSQLREADLAARYGGDEFVVLLPHTEADRARVLGERIVERLAIELQSKFPEAPSSLSVGIASLHDVSDPSAEELLKAADRALYAAKTAGKNRIMAAGGLSATTSG
jgi:diguanylate cyclase (GGDEF)-like protein